MSDEVFLFDFMIDEPMEIVTEANGLLSLVFQLGVGSGAPDEMPTVTTVRLRFSLTAVDKLRHYLHAPETNRGTPAEGTPSPTAH